MYDYPLDLSWTTEEIIDIMSLYNAVEKAYEEGISKEEFMGAYRKFCAIVDSKSEQKKIDAAFEKASTYSIYRVFKQCENHDWIEMK